jgi:hypothetical protein
MPTLGAMSRSIAAAAKSSGITFCCQAEPMASAGAEGGEARRPNVGLAR